MRNPNGSCTWIGLKYHHSARRFQLLPVGDDLYEGRSGIALFLLALDAVNSSDAHRETALAALAPLRRKLACLETNSSAASAHVQRTGLGIGQGIGSMIYALTHAARWLDDAELLEDARRAGRMMTPAAIEADRSLDVLLGAAGGLLGQLSLYHMTQDGDVLERAAACGRHLLDCQILSGDARGGWRSNGEHAPAGLSHGAAGISYALLRLFAATGDDSFRRAALAGIEYENGLFSHEYSNWRDVRVDEPALAYLNRWCHGAAGIGLARLGAASIYEADSVHRDVERAVQCTTHSPVLSPIDAPCCGNFGPIELLAETGRFWRDAGLHDEALRRCQCVLQRARTCKGFTLFTGKYQQAFSPGFFQGLSGIGYSLLRAAFPDRLPSILLFQ